MSVRWRDDVGKWEVRWAENGRKRSRCITRRRDAEAFDAKQKRIRELGGVVQLLDDVPTLAEFVEDTWWELHAIPNLAENTRVSYAQVWDKHALPRLGGYSLLAITPKVIARFKRDLEKADVGAPTIHRVLSMLQGVMRLAMTEYSSLRSNPVAVVPKPKQKIREGFPIWPDTVEAIRRQLGHRDQVLVSILAYGGLRPQEALALQWKHVLDGAMRVERALARGKVKKLKGKGEGHSRDVELLDPLAKDIAAWRLASGRPPDRQLVFPAHDGELWSHDDYRNWRRRTYKPAAAAAGLEAAHRRPYDMRGSFISLMIYEGRNVVEVAELAGHTPETCLRYYARVFRDAPKPPISAVDAIRRARDSVQERLAI
jgi:integrase